MRRSTAWIAGGALAAAATGAGVAALVLGGGDGADASSRDGDRPPATAKVVRTDLVQSKTVDGQLDYAQRRTVSSAVDGTVTVAADAGGTVTQGQALYELNDKPVTLLYGQIPMFRAMKPGDRGSDVLQLERNLRDLGFGAGLYIDPRYDAATKAAVRSWQEPLNRTPTGTVGKGDVVFQPDRVKVVSADAAAADQVGPDTTVLTVASTKPVVRAQLDQQDVSLTAKGTTVKVTLPGGRTVRGEVSGTVRPESSDDDPSAAARDGITVEVTLDGGRSAVSGEDTKATVNVSFVSESRQNVLAVPVEAVVALRGEHGGYGLELVKGDTTRMVRVETGMTADGRIEVSGVGLREGMTVGVAER